MAESANFCSQCGNAVAKSSWSLTAGLSADETSRSQDDQSAEKPSADVCQADISNENTTTSPKYIVKQPYEVLPNGKRRYIRATGIDMFISGIFPIVGLIIGAMALVRGERQRGLTMMGIAIVLTLIVVIIRKSN